MKANLPKRKKLSGASAALLMARMFLRISLGRRRMLWVGLALLLPPALTAWGRLSMDGSGADLFLEMVVNLMLQFEVLGLTLYLGVAAVRDEVEDGTIVYLLTRPVARWAIVGGKFLAVVFGVALALIVDLLLVYTIALGPDGVGAFLSNLGYLLFAAWALLLAVVAYTGLFGLLGTIFNHPMIPALVLAFGWEGVVSNLPGGIPKGSLMFYIKSVLGLGPENNSLLNILMPSVDPVSVTMASVVLVVASVLLWVSALVVATKREFEV